MEEPRKAPVQRNERLRLHRTQRNWRQQDVADELGIAVITVRRWERGSQQPSAYYRVKLCTLFGLSVHELGLVEDAPSSSLSPESEDVGAMPVGTSPSREEITLWTIPYGRNPHFTGRDDLLEYLEQQFAQQGPKLSTTLRQAALTQPQAIKGLGGIGKTQVAVEYAYRARLQGRYTHTLWINAASEEAILTSFASLADFLLPVLPQDQSDQRKLVAAVIHWLEGCLQPWLLILDNADDLPLVQPYLPRQGNGNILLTTRANAMGSLAVSVEVDTMGVIEGTQLVLRRAQRFAEASDEEINEASNLVVLLGQFPLALDQAGAYIEETGCSVRDYLQLYQQHRHALLARRGRQVTQHPDAVATTWSLSFERVEQINPAAGELLRLCAFLSPDHIPEELLIQGAPYWPAALQQAVADRFAFNQMLETLLAFSLVKRLAEDHLLSIHRLVQVVQIEHIPQQEQRQWAERLIRAMHTVFPRNPESEMTSWSLCQRYLEQAQLCDLLIQQHQFLFSEAADLLAWTGAYLLERALYPLAEQLLQRALHIREQQLGPEHPDVIALLNALGNLYHFQGRYAEAEHFYQRALHIQEQQLGPEHPDVAKTMNDLATLYWQYGRYAEAEPLYQRALHIREQQLGSKHSEVGNSLNSLATLYCRQGLYIEAEPLLQRALHIWEQQLGPDHPMVAFALNNLAFLYLQLRNDGQCEPLLQRALHIWEQQLGPDHPNVALALHGLALLHSQQGDDEQAESFYQRTLHIREQHLEADHPDMAHVLHDFAVFRQKQGKNSEAILLYQRALAIREQVFEPDHPMTIETRERLQAVQETRQ